MKTADAVPVFSRKYHTSCQTCHVIFPKLNPFGEAFRLNGYRMPGETEEQVKQVPVSLGSEAYEKLWPKMVYPSTLPGNVPLALNVKFADLYASAQDDAGHQILHNDFQFPQEVNLFAAGTLGNHMSFFGEFTYGELPDGSIRGRDRARAARLRQRVRDASTSSTSASESSRPTPGTASRKCGS